MKKTVIKAEDIAKLYRLGEVGTGTISHDLNRWWAGLRGKEDPFAKIGQQNDRTKKSESNYAWALKNISFEVEQGDVLGIIGRNGAGKSTLLKILSKVTTPTTGEIKINGKISSLLEVGTGFHPELTGRENIFLNGAILGMKKAEIKNKFDEIVSFSGVEGYIDTPVRRYSSGMYVRLAFAVAAHLEPDILIVDEVLAVGDAEFQKKCLGKMKSVSTNEGRTVLFVSHNMAAVKQLCNKGLVLQHGKISFEGDARESVNFYQSTHDTNSFFEHSGSTADAPGNDNIRILKFEIKSSAKDEISVSTGFNFEVTFYNFRNGINLDATFELKNADEVIIFHHGCIISNQKNAQKGIYTVKGTVPGNLLNAGNYIFNLIFGEDQRYVLLNISDFIGFEIMNEHAGSNTNILPGMIRPQIDYQTSFNA